MNGRLERFGEKWLGRLNEGARTTFSFRDLEETGLHSAVADRFVADLGMKPIGFNWELLDTSPGAQRPRSAFAQLVEALTHDISNPARPWLGREEAEECARDFLGAFDPGTRTVVSNRYDGLWNPISGAGVEWGFVASDGDQIALLLITDQ